MTKCMRCGLLFLLSVFFLGTSLHASPGEARTLFRNAQATFETALQKKGEERQLEMLKAAGLFLQIVEEQGITNGYLYYNIGNCYFEAGQKGRALQFYEKARRFIPGDPDLAENLQQLERELAQPKQPQRWYEPLQETLFFWHYLWGYGERQLIFFTFFCLFWAALLVSFFVRHLFMRGLLTVLLLGALLTGGSFGVSYYNCFYQQRAVVIEPQADARKGPGVGYEPYYQQQLPEGIRLVILEQLEQWYQVERDNGDRFWLPAHQVGVI